MLMRVANLHTAPIESIAPGKEGELPDSPPVRGLVKSGLLRIVSDGDPPTIAATGEAVESLRARFDAAWREREEHHRRELEAARGDLDMAGRARRAAELEAIATRLEAENAALRAELEASKAKGPKSKTDPKPEG